MDTEIKLSDCSIRELKRMRILAKTNGAKNSDLFLKSINAEIRLKQDDYQQISHLKAMAKLNKILKKEVKSG